MGNLLRAELHKLIKQKSLYICMGIVILLIAVPILIFASEDMQNVGTYLFLSSFSGSGIDMLLPVLISLLLCGDFTSGTVRLMVGRGYSRASIYLSKFILTFAVVLFAGAISWCTALICISAFLDCDVLINGRILLMLTLQLAAMFAVGVFSFLVAMLTRKSAITIAAGLITPSAGTILITLSDVFLKKVNFKITDYWFFTFLAELSEQSTSNSVLLRCGVVTLIYIAVFFVVGLLAFNKSDI